MITKNFISILTVAVFFISCSKIDNYDAPNGGIFGKLTDKITNEPLQASEPNGFTIKLFEKGSSMGAPISFDGKPDGTFENRLLFQNEYKVIPCEGAFFPLDTVIKQIGGRTEINFDVIPFLAVPEVTVAASAGQVTANYNIVRAQVGDKIIERETLVSRAPMVSDVVFDFKSMTDLSGTADEDILSGQYTDVVTGLTSGQTYYVRIAVLTDNALKRYNYSKVFSVLIP